MRYVPLSLCGNIGSCILTRDYCFTLLTDDLQQFAVLVVLEYSAVAVAVCDEKRAGRLGDCEGCRLAKVLLVTAGHECFSQDEVGFVRVGWELEIIMHFSEGLVLERQDDICLARDLAWPTQHCLVLRFVIMFYSPS